jgi:hypothetical protein
MDYWSYLMFFDGRWTFWEACIQSVSEEILHILWNTKVCYYIYMNEPVKPTLSKMNPVRMLISYSFQESNTF